MRQPTALLYFLLIASTLTIPALPAISQEPPELSSPQPSPQSTSGSSLEDLIQTFAQQRRPRPGGIRRGGLCALTPATDTLQSEALIWSDRPLFSWRNNPSNIRVTAIQVYTPNNDEIIWEKNLSPEAQRIAYDGNPLQIGQIYVWELQFERHNPQNDTWAPERISYTFQVLASDRHAVVSSGLQTLIDSLPRLTAEGLAIRQARYFADQGLLSDAIQVLYAVENPSPELTQQLQSLVGSFCSDNSTTPQ